MHRELLLKKEQGNAVLAFVFAVNSRLTSCTLLTSVSSMIRSLKWNILVHFDVLIIALDTIPKEYYKLLLTLFIGAGTGSLDIT